MNTNDFSRRDVLRLGGGLAAASMLPTSALARSLWTPDAFLPGASKTKRVVLVVFGGGVRSRETLQSDNVPNLSQLAAEGVLYTRADVRNNGHYGSATNIFTGAFESYGIRENARTPYPTLFEYIRRDAELPASEVWLSTSGSDQETNYAFSSDATYGSRYGANLIGGEGIFNAELREVLLGSGMSNRESSDERATYEALRGAIRTPMNVSGETALNDPEAAQRIEQYITDELRGGVSDITGLGANDAKALRVARNLLGVFKPKLLAVTLRNADVAHGSFNDYVTVIRRADSELGSLMTAIRGDPELADSTAVFVLPEFGRDRDLNARRGLDHGDASDELHKVSLVAWGPDFRRGKTVSRDVQSIDVTPTIAKMFGARTPKSRGSTLPQLFA